MNEGVLIAGRTFHVDERFPAAGRTTSSVGGVAYDVEVGTQFRSVTVSGLKPHCDTIANAEPHYTPMTRNLFLLP